MYSDPSVLVDVEFLLGSANRLDVLDAIHTAPRDRHELRERTGASRVTCSRVLGDLEDRSWIVRRNGTYQLTPRGAAVAREIERLFDNLEAVDGLDGTLQWLPIEQFDFELGRLADATVITSTDRELTAAITRTADRVRDTTRVRNVATGISAEVVDAYLDAATTGIGRSRPCFTRPSSTSSQRTAGSGDDFGRCWQQRTSRSDATTVTCRRSY